MCSDRLEPCYSKTDINRPTMFENFNKRLRRGKVDITNAACRAKCLASSAPDRRVSIVFSLVTVRTQTRFAFSKIGIASATARAAGRLKSQATITVSSAYDPIRFRVWGKTTVGHPEPKMIDSAYH